MGSDPARLTTTAVLSEDKSHYVMNGTKLWCTNGTLAKLLVVMAVDPDSGRISAFMVEKDSPGVSVEHRCHFMGLRALANAVIVFNDVKVPADNLIGKEEGGPQDRAPRRSMMADSPSPTPVSGPQRSA